MRKSGQAKAAKKAGRIAAEGVIFARTEGNVAVMIELNCETDFVSKDAGFRPWEQKFVERCCQKITDVDAESRRPSATASPSSDHQQP